MDEKKIHIVGGANRYQIKKLTKEKAPPKKRVIASKWELDPDHFTAEKQLSLLEQDTEPLIKTEIDHKISAYNGATWWARQLSGHEKQLARLFAD